MVSLLTLICQFAHKSLSLNRRRKLPHTLTQTLQIELWILIFIEMLQNEVSFWFPLLLNDIADVGFLNKIW